MLVNGHKSEQCTLDKSLPIICAPSSLGVQLAPFPRNHRVAALRFSVHDSTQVQCLHVISAFWLTGEKIQVCMLHPIIGEKGSVFHQIGWLAKLVSLLPWSFT